MPEDSITLEPNAVKGLVSNGDLALYKKHGVKQVTPDKFCDRVTILLNEQVYLYPDETQPIVRGVMIMPARTNHHKTGLTQRQIMIREANDVTSGFETVLDDELADYLTDVIIAYRRDGYDHLTIWNIFIANYKPAFGTFDSLLTEKQTRFMLAAKRFEFVDIRIHKKESMPLYYELMRMGRSIKQRHACRLRYLQLLKSSLLTSYYVIFAPYSKAPLSTSKLGVDMEEMTLLLTFSIADSFRISDERGFKLIHGIDTAARCNLFIRGIYNSSRTAFVHCWSSQQNESLSSVPRDVILLILQFVSWLDIRNIVHPLGVHMTTIKKLTVHEKCLAGNPNDISQYPNFTIPLTPAKKH